jgi:hypothetical protein
VSITVTDNWVGFWVVTSASMAVNGSITIPLEVDYSFAGTPANIEFWYAPSILDPSEIEHNASVVVGYSVTALTFTATPVGVAAVAALGTQHVNDEDVYRFTFAPIATYTRAGTITIELKTAFLEATSCFRLVTPTTATLAGVTCSVTGKIITVNGWTAIAAATAFDLYITAKKSAQVTGTFDIAYWDGTTAASKTEEHAGLSTTAYAASGLANSPTSFVVEDFYEPEIALL